MSVYLELLGRCPAAFYATGVHSNRLVLVIDMAIASQRPFNQKWIIRASIIRTKESALQGDSCCPSRDRVYTRTSSKRLVPGGANQ